MDLYLITGFLGAGKTTFLKNFVKFFGGRELLLIINDFGKVGVDGALLEAVHAAMSEISNGSIFCACRLDKFEEALENALREQPQVILVEASGLADPTGVEKLLAQERFSRINYCGSLCLVDTPRLERVIHTARVLPKQLRVSSLVLLNKTDLAQQDQLARAREQVLALNPLAQIRETQFGAFREEWMDLIHPLRSGDPDRLPDIQLQKQLLKVAGDMEPDQLRHALNMLAEESWRIKGFVTLQGKHYLVNCVGPSVSLEEYDHREGSENMLVLLAGPGMALRKAIRETTSWYPQLIKESSNAI